MIEINLLPEELRVKTKEKVVEQVTMESGSTFKQDQLFVYAIPVLFVLFVLVHLYFGVVSISQNVRLASLNRKWIDFGPQKKVLDEFNLKYSAASQDAGLTQLLIKQRVLWAQKLNDLSLNLPVGVWFNDISFTKQNITIQGSVISLKMDELNLINKLLDGLKTDSEFSKDFTNLELSNVQRRTVGSYDITDFVLQGTLRPR
ncbi:MAG: PilN domain-containing protein [Candidatus Omnitrophota bacterium]|nr:PilN domain-containing protein [Candidatus Omnitrophota bacterium]